jgi:hypothetical protein
MWRQRIAQASGAALGYIGGNIPGAIIGWNVGGRLTQNNSMARNVVRNRRRRPSNVQNARGNRGVRGRRNSSKRRAVRGKTVTGIRSVVSTKTYGKKHFKRVKVPKISKAFRKKVEKCLDEKLPDGDYTSIHFGKIELDANADFLGYGDGNILAGSSDNFGNNRQFIFSRTTSINWNFNHFNFKELMVSLQRTWFDYPKSEGLLTENLINLDAEINTKEAPELVSANGNSSFIDMNNQLLQTTYKIKSSKISYCFKNNSSRSYEMKFYFCSPKRKLELESDPLNVWQNGMINDRQFSQAVSSLNPVGARGFGINITPNPATPNTLYMTPNVSADYKNTWKHEYKMIRLEPGQCYNFVRNGPKNVSFQPNKWFNLLKAKTLNTNTDADITNLGGTQHFTWKPSFSESMFIVIVPELLVDPTSNLASAVRIMDGLGAGEDRLGIAVEKKVEYTWEMPDTVGFRRTMVNTSGGVDSIKNPILNNRHRRYWYNVYNRSAIAAVDVAALVHREEPQRPGVDVPMG